MSNKLQVMFFAELIQIGVLSLGEFKSCKVYIWTFMRVFPAFGNIGGKGQAGRITAFAAVCFGARFRISWGFMSDHKFNVSMVTELTKEGVPVFFGVDFQLDIERDVFPGTGGLGGGDGVIMVGNNFGNGLLNGIFVHAD
jgi:hypothetical protein